MAMKRPAFTSIDRVHLLLPEGRAREPHVAIVNAPPGFGKTRLLKSVEAIAMGRDLPVVRAGGWEQMRAALKRPRRLTRAALWLLDDLVTGPDTSRLLDTFADAIERGGSIIAATRYRSLANLISVRLPDQHRIVDEKALQLTDGELSELAGRSLTNDQLDRLARVTGRWPTGVRLLNARDGEILPSDLDGAVTRATAPLVSYFDSLEPYMGTRELSFAALVADLGQLSSGLISDAFENYASAIIAALKTLSQAGAFVTENIGTESAFTFHPMFVEYLRHRTPTLELPQEEISRACVRLAQMGHARTALRLAPIVRDTSAAGEIATALGGIRLPMTAPGKLMRYHTSQARSVFDALDLTISNMYSKLLYGQTTEAAQLMQILEGSGARGSALDQAKTATAKLIFLYHQGGPLPIGDVDGVERQFAGILESEPFLRALLAHLRSAAYYRQGCYTQSIGALAYVREASEVLGAPLLNAFRLLSVGLSQFRLGHLHGAVESLRLALAMVQDSFGTSSPQSAYNSLLLSHVLGELGDHQEADSLWTKYVWALDLYPGWREGLEVTVASHLNRVFRAHGVQDTLDALDSWEAARNPQVRENFAARTLLFRLQIEMRAGRLVTAREHLEKATTGHSPVSAIDAIMTEILRARIAIELGDCGIGQLQRSIAPAQNIDDVFVQFSASFAQYRYHRVFGEESQAVTALEDVLTLTRRHQLHAALSEEWPNIEKRHCERIRTGHNFDFLRQIERPTSGDAAVSKSGLDTLSARENQVLVFLQQGMSSKEIAALLDISAGSVQGYRRRLYKKLGAHHRSQVVQAARRQTPPRAG
jgi:ATP/maltotriose-dependent transcriptional regulator MalT